MKKPALQVSATPPKTFDELVRLYPPRAIRDAVDYANTQEWIDRLTSLPQLTAGQAEYLDTLATLLHAYEAEHHPITTDDLTPLDLLKHLLEQHGLTASDLGRLLGDRALGAKILKGTRELSKAHIRLLADHFGLEASLFL